MNHDQPNIEAAKRSVAAQAYGDVAARGIFLMMANSVFSKAVGFVAQIVLGWLLSQDDYAIWALGISVYGVLATVRDGGLQKILIQRGKEYDSLASPVFQMALLFNLGFAGVLVASAPYAAEYFETPILPLMFWVLALTAVISTPSMIFQAKVMRDLRFGLLTRISATSAVISCSSMILFALLGFGPLSFVIPGALIAVYEGIAYGIAGGLLPNLRMLRWPLFKGLMRASGWIMLGALAAALINGGDYLVIGKLQKDILGDYTFGYQLSASFALLFVLSARSVLMPTFAQFGDQPERFGNAYVRSIRVLIFVTAPLCVVAALIVAPIVNVLWQGKWNAAIPVIQIMMLSLVFRMLTPLALAAMEARGNWKLQSILLLIDGAGTVLAALIGCRIGGIVAIAICVGVNRAGMALLQCIAAGAIAGVSATRILNAMLPPVVSAALCGAAGYYVARLIVPLRQEWLHIGLAAGICAATFGAISWALMQARIVELLAIFQSVRRPARQS